MYNTSKVSLFFAEGVILPHSGKVLTLQDIDKKISKMKGHIAHLDGQLSERQTHGGKGFRTRQISLLDQRAIASSRLDLLQQAESILKPKGNNSSHDEPQSPERKRKRLDTEEVVNDIQKKPLLSSLKRQRSSDLGQGITAS